MKQTKAIYEEYELPNGQILIVPNFKDTAKLIFNKKEVE